MTITLNGTTGINTPALDSTGPLTSPGIDDNATSTAMTLDSGGNLLVNTTSGSSPITLQTRSGEYYQTGMQINSTNADFSGAIMDVRATSGSINTTNGRFLRFYSDNGSTERFHVKGSGEIYTASGILLGGTGAANKLDDYEEGYHEVTLTPANGGSITLSATQRYLSYTKIGNRVFVTGKVDISSVSSPLGHVKISLPFPIDATSPAGTNDSRRTAGSIWITNSSINITQFVLYGIENESAIRIYVGDGTANQDTTGQKLSSTHGVAFTFNYRTA